MQLAHIELSKLVVSSANMRAKRKDRDIQGLVPSVRARGVLVPLLVRPNGEPGIYEIVAGRRRYFAAAVVAGSQTEPMSVPCAIMEAGDDAAAIEASLLENVARLDADEVTQWETFSRLVNEGRGVENIAATFGIAEQVVRRVLALGNLLPRIRSLYRKELIDVATVRHLTMATTAQQRQWLALHESPDEYAPTGRTLKEWLFGGAAIPTSIALFDPAEYTAPIIGDLFEDNRYFSDAALFWTLQMKAVEEKRQAYLTEGWSDVMISEPGSYFDRWAYEKRGKAKGGRVYIVVNGGGAVETYEGYLPRKEVQKMDKKSGGQPTTARPELSAPLRRYVELHRHAIIRTRLLAHPGMALRLLLAHTIAGSALWSVRTETQRADKPETEVSVAESAANAAFDAARVELLSRIGLPLDLRQIVGEVASLEEASAALLRLDDEELGQVAAVVMGETLEASGRGVYLLSACLDLNPASLWQADEAFFTLLRDRKVLCAIVAELAGPEIARANGRAPSKVLKAIIRDCLTGQNGRSRVDGWVPRWLDNPAGTYLDTSAALCEQVEESEPEAAE